VPDAPPPAAPIDAAAAPIDAAAVPVAPVDTAPARPDFRIDRAFIWRQVKVNIVAIVSVFVALTGLGYNTWRNEHTERNRNTRIAAFETLKSLGEAQIIVEYAHFKKNRQLGDPLQGVGRAMYIRDLAGVLPPPAPEYAEQLWVAWRDNADKVETDTDAMIAITDEIQRLRLAVLEILSELK
jgi:hypothetical protein